MATLRLDASVSASLHGKTRGGEANVEAILEAALAIFASEGFSGARIEAIATRAGLSKPNLLYYFRTKADLYRAVLQRTLDMWLVPLNSMVTQDDPARALADYVTRKLEYARDYPQASRLFAMEIMRGAPLLGDVLRHDLRAMVDAKVQILRRWMQAGRLPHRDPHHLLFAIWATTQHYADFAAQVSALTGRSLADDAFFATARASLLTMLLGQPHAAPTQ